MGTVGKRSWFFHGFHSPLSFPSLGHQRHRDQSGGKRLS